MSAEKVLAAAVAKSEQLGVKVLAHCHILTFGNVVWCCPFCISVCPQHFCHVVSQLILCRCKGSFFLKISFVSFSLLRSILLLTGNKNKQFLVMEKIPFHGYSSCALIKKLMKFCSDEHLCDGQWGKPGRISQDGWSLARIR